MKIVIWKAYGDVSVYPVNTATEFEKFIRLVIPCLENWGLEETIALVEKHIDRHVGNYKEMVPAFATLRNAIDPSDDNDQFEILELSELHEYK